MWWFGGEREERDEGERESSETGRRLYCCMEEALGTGINWKEREERGGYIRGAGFVSAIGCDLLGMERKWVKDRTEVMGFDFDSRGEGKGKRDEKEQNWKLCFIPGRGFASQLVSRLRCITSCLLSLPTNLSFRAVELPSKNNFGEASCAPGIRRSASPDPSLDRNRSLIHREPRARESGHINCRPFTRPLSVTWVQSVPPFGCPPSDHPSNQSITCSQ
jgi:hypothetical protein